MDNTNFLGDNVSLPCTYKGSLKKDKVKVEGQYSLNDNKNAGNFELII
jgi:hypothetical protein